MNIISVLTVVLGVWANSLPKVGVSEATSLYKKGHFQKVIDGLSPHIEKLSRQEILLLGNSYSGLKNHRAAFKTFNSLLGTLPKDPEIKTLMGREQFRMGKENEALNLLKEALSENDKYEPAYLLTAEIYQKRKNNYELRMVYQDMIEKIGEKPIYVLKVCESATLDGLYELSAKTCRRSMQLNSKEPLSYIFLGLTLKETGDPNQGQSFLKQAADSFPKSAKAQIVFGHFLEEKKNFVQAYNYFLRATQADPKSTEAWVGMGLNGTEIQKYQESLRAFEASCRVDATNTIQQFRRAASTLRTYGVSKWLEKYEAGIENCRSSSN